MKPVDQTKFVDHVPNDDPEAAGNCFQSCVASVLELALDDVPHFAALPAATWWGSFVDWANAAGYDVVAHDDAPDGFAICSGRSPRGAFYHAVVVEDGVIVHDPHPSRDGLLTRAHYITLPTRREVALAP